MSSAVAPRPEYFAFHLIGIPLQLCLVEPLGVLKIQVIASMCQFVNQRVCDTRAAASPSLRTCRGDGHRPHVECVEVSTFTGRASALYAFIRKGVILKTISVFLVRLPSLNLSVVQDRSQLGDAFKNGLRIAAAHCAVRIERQVTCRVRVIARGVLNVTIEVRTSTCEPGRVFAGEASDALKVVPGAVII